MEPSDYWSMWEAIGTIASALIGLTALLLVTIPRILDYLRRPNLKLEPKILRISHLWREYGISITNKGKETAKGIIIKIESIEPEHEWIVAPYTNLKEINMLHNEFFEDVPLFNLEWEQGVITFPKAQITIDIQNTIIKIIVTGDNFTTFRQSFKFLDSDDIITVKLVKI